MVTGLYAGLAGLWLVFLIFRVVRLRLRHLVVLGDGGNRDLERVMRTHGNFIETVPFILILMALIEIGGGSFVPVAVLHMMGAVMLVGRGLHFVGMNFGIKFLKLRMIGMVLTLLVIIAGAGILIVRAIGSMAG